MFTGAELWQIFEFLLLGAIFVQLVNTEIGVGAVGQAD